MPDNACAGAELWSPPLSGWQLMTWTSPGIAPRAAGGKVPAN